MRTAAAWRAGVATDPGLQRIVNEDRALVDDALGLFLVVDGLGGHAAGEMAAETAVRAITGHMESAALEGRRDVEDNIRRAITEANNQIYLLAQQNEDWNGMACVLTLAVAGEEGVTVGHVGDSRLYLIWNGNLRKLTSDHSPVGEQEEHGELTEEEAMQHPRRNEVFRDVGSQPHEPHDPQFIETRTFRFRQDAALLLCSDGLSDVLTSGEISAVVERYDGDPDSTARQLVEAANRAGGKDNISVVFVAGADFLGSDSNTLLEVRPRHAATRMRKTGSRWRTALRNALLLIAGMILGILLWIALERVWGRSPAPAPGAAQAARQPGARGWKPVAK
ncbi:MAG TPA: protein phosphatase 2C domain-containing protein [Bryobacteraceae bacterium]|jgi:serine/threonine protein phosphatase PrpC|nr:protein phosphatase 2C domain-containing protein [Bryobacteraceae bacterium]